MASISESLQGIGIKIKRGGLDSMLHPAWSAV